VRGDKFQVEFAREGNQFRVNAGEFWDTVFLQFNIKTVLENVLVPADEITRLLGLALNEQGGNFGGEAARRRNDALRVLFENALVNARFLVKPFQLRDGREFQKVFVSRLVLGEQEQVVGRAVKFGIAFLYRVAGEVTFNADDWFHPVFFAGVVELDGGEHRPVVGQGDGGHLELVRAGGDGFGTSQPIEQRVFGMDVQVDEFRHA